MSLAPGQQELQRVAARWWITFEGDAGPGYHITAGELIRRLHDGTEIPDGTKVRCETGDDHRGWYEVRIVRGIEEALRPRARTFMTTIGATA